MILINLCLERYFLYLFHIFKRKYRPLYSLHIKVSYYFILFATILYIEMNKESNRRKLIKTLFKDKDVL